MAILASGAGSNAERIMAHFENHPSVSVKLVLSSKKTAGVLQKAENFGIETLILDKERFMTSDTYIQTFQREQIDILILAGFLWKVPPNLVAAFPERIINIHPALLPKYGGKGMYGTFVHEAVIKAGEKESGITIHLVDEAYDHGKHLFQTTCPVEQTDTPDLLAGKIHSLEHQYFAKTIEAYILKNPALFNRGQ